MSSSRATEPNTRTLRARCLDAMASTSPCSSRSLTEGRGRAAARSLATMVADGLRLPFSYAAMFGWWTPERAARSFCDSAADWRPARICSSAPTARQDHLISDAFFLTVSNGSAVARRRIRGQHRSHGEHRPGRVHARGAVAPATVCAAAHVDGAPPRGPASDGCRRRRRVGLPGDRPGPRCQSRGVRHLPRAATSACLADGDRARAGLVRLLARYRGGGRCCPVREAGSDGDVPGSRRRHELGARPAPALADRTTGPGRPGADGVAPTCCGRVSLSVGPCGGHRRAGDLRGPLSGEVGARQRVGPGGAGRRCRRVPGQQPAARCIRRCSAGLGDRHLLPLGAGRTGAANLGSGRADGVGRSRPAGRPDRCGRSPMAAPRRVRDHHPDR